MYLRDLCCSRCGQVYDPQTVQTYCSKNECNSPLYAGYALPADVSPASLLAGKPATMWRYREFLPIRDARNIISLGEGFTPIIPLRNLDMGEGGGRVSWKDESGNPTGSFKSRGMSVAVSKAVELGLTDLVTPTAGNAGGALAAYCARAKIRAHVYMPKRTPQIFKDECHYYGATLTEVDGNISDCGELAQRDAAKRGWFSVATLKEPYRLEGKKTMGYEIAEQFNWLLPDVILYPTGGGTGLLGIWKAFEEMAAMGWIGNKRPRMVAVQSESCDGIYDAFHSRRPVSLYADKGFTIANGLRVPKPFADRQILEVLRDSNGTAVRVGDKEMITAMKEIALQEGMLIAPEGAALWPAYKMLRASGWLHAGESVLLLNTGNGYKYLENINVPA